MRSLASLLAATPALLLAACADVAPPAPAAARGPALDATATTCRPGRTYFFENPIHDNALTIVVFGHKEPRKNSDRAVLAYELFLDDQMEADISAAIAGGCTAEILFRTVGYTSTLGASRAEYGATVAVTKLDATAGGTITVGSIDDHWSQAPLPPDCTHTFSCLVNHDWVMPLGSTLMATLHAKDRFQLVATGSAFARVIGTGVGDQAQAGFNMPQGDGRNPYGPRLHIPQP